MFVPRAHVYLGRPNKKSWFSGSSRPKHQLPKHKIKCFEYVRMPCLIPTFVGALIGFMIMLAGALVCFIGYNPEKFFDTINVRSSSNDNSKLNDVLNVTEPTFHGTTPEYTSLRFLTYIGPVFMGIGFFILIVAVVLYCEIKDKYVTHILPDKNVKQMKKDELYDMIIREFRKNYFRGIEVPLKEKEPIVIKPVEKEMPTLFKALSISTPALLITPEMHRKWRERDDASSVTVTNERKVEHVKHTFRTKRRDSWLKTASLPNIRPKTTMRDILKNCDKAKSQHWQLKREINPNVRHVRVDNTGVDNPAFRDSPTETIHLQELSHDISPDSPVFSHGTHLTKVLVHMDASPNNKLSDSDARGYTLRRRIGDEQRSDLAEVKCLTKSSNDTIISPEEVVVNCGDSELDRTEMPRIKSLFNIAERRCSVDNKKLGPYKTCIGIFKSEPCLGRTGRQGEEKEDDELSEDSIVLSEELLKNFEMKNLVQV